MPTVRMMWCAASFLAVSNVASAQWLLQGPRTETFDDFRGTGLSADPTAGELDSTMWRITPSFAPGNESRATAFDAEVNIGELARGTSIGGAVTGGLYAFDVASPALAYALGVQPNGTFMGSGSGAITLRLLNPTQTAITSIRVAYAVHSRNDAGRETLIALAYADDDMEGQYSDIVGSDFLTGLDPVPGGAAWETVERVLDIPVDLPAGAEGFLRWTVGDGPSGSGSRDEIALDDLEITPTFAAQTPFRLADAAAYLESFDTFAGSGFSPDPTTGELNSSAFRVIPMLATLSGETAFGETVAGGSIYGRGIASAPIDAGGIYAFVVAAGANHALGIQPSGSNFTQGGAVIARAFNATSRSSLRVRVSYTVWVRDDQTRSTRVSLAWATMDAAALYTDVPSADFATATTPTTSVWVANEVSVDLDIDVAPGQMAYFQWTVADNGGSGSRDEIALDDISFAVLPDALPDAGAPLDASIADAMTTLDAEVADAMAGFDATTPDATAETPDATAETPDATAETPDATTPDATFGTTDAATPDDAAVGAEPTTDAGMLDDAAVNGPADSSIPDASDTVATDSGDDPVGRQTKAGCGCAAVGLDRHSDDSTALWIYAALMLIVVRLRTSSSRRSATRDRRTQRRCA